MTALLTSYFLSTRSLPNKWEEAQEVLSFYMRQTADQVNERVVGQYLPQEIPAGKKFALTGRGLPVLRKLINIGALPNNTTKNVPHGISINSSFRLLDLYLCANDPVNNSYFCAQCYSRGAGQSVEISMDATNIIIQTHADYTAYTDCYAIIEFMRTS